MKDDKMTDVGVFEMSGCGAGSNIWALTPTSSFFKFLVAATMSDL